MPLREIGGGRTMDEGDMGHHRYPPSECVIDLLLPCAVGEVIVASDHMRDSHVMIVDHYGEHIGRRSVGTQQDEIVEVFVLPENATMDLILDHRLSNQRRLKTSTRLDA